MNILDPGGPHDDRVQPQRAPNATSRAALDRRLYWDQDGSGPGAAPCGCRHVMPRWLQDAPKM